MDINLKASLPGGGKKFTGTLPMNDIDTALITLETIYGLKAEKAGDKIILR